MTASDASKPAAGGGKLSIGQLLFREAGAELLNIARDLPADASLEDFRRALAEHANREGVGLFAAVAAYQDGEREPGLKLRDVLHAVIDGVFLGREELTVAGALQWMDEHGHWWEMLRTFLNDVLTSEKASVVPDLVAGHSWVFPVPIGEGYKLPVMIAVSTPFTPRKEWLGRVSYQFQDAFKPMAQMKPESLREAARAIPGWMQDKESRDIADELFEEEGYRERLKREHPEWSRAEVDRKFAKAVGTRAMRLRKRKAHFLEVVKKVMGGNAQA